MEPNVFSQIGNATTPGGEVDDLEAKLLEGRKVSDERRNARDRLEKQKRLNDMLEDRKVEDERRKASDDLDKQK